MPRFLPVGKDAQGAARFLLAALPALGALLTALAITGDLVGRMARNHPWASFAAFGCAVLAVFLGAVAAFSLKENSGAERRVLYAGLVVLGVGLVFTVYAGVTTWGDRPQPSITVTPKRGSIVAVSVHGIGLRSSDHMVVEVEQLLRVNDRRGHQLWKPGQPLYGASLGPNGAGEIEQTVDLPLPPGDFDDVGARAWVGDEPRPCYTHGNTTGCVRVHIPRPQERPQLSVVWETFVRAPRDRGRSAAAQPGGVVTRAGCRGRLRPAPVRGRRARVLGRLRRREHLDPRAEVSTDRRRRDGMVATRGSRRAVDWLRPVRPRASVERAAGTAIRGSIGGRHARIRERVLERRKSMPILRRRP